LLGMGRSEDPRLSITRAAAEAVHKCPLEVEINGMTTFLF